jgi:hypothetical protein
MGIHKNTLGYTHMPMKMGIQLLHAITSNYIQLALHVGSKDKQKRPDSGIQPFNLSRNHAHRETQRDPRLHLPICPRALCDIPHMHSCVILADCARDSVQHGAQLHIDSHICRNTFAKQRDPRITRIIHLPACMCVGKGSKTPKNTKKQRGLRKRT